MLFYIDSVYHVIPRDFLETLPSNELFPSLSRKKEVKFFPFERRSVLQKKALLIGCRKFGVKSKTQCFEVGKNTI